MHWNMSHTIVWQEHLESKLFIVFHLFAVSWQVPKRNYVKKPASSISKELNNKPAPRPSLPNDDEDEEDEESPQLTINFAATSMDHGYHLPPPSQPQPQCKYKTKLKEILSNQFFNINVKNSSYCSFYQGTQVKACCRFFLTTDNWIYCHVSYLRSCYCMTQWTPSPEREFIAWRVLMDVYLILEH